MSGETWISLSKAIEGWEQFLPDWNGPYRYTEPSDGSGNECYTEAFSALVNKEFSEALSVPEFSLMGTPMVDPKSSKLAAREVVPSKHFLEPRSFFAQHETIEPFHESHPTAHTIAPSALHPRWINVIVHQKSFETWVQHNIRNLVFDDIQNGKITPDEGEAHMQKIRFRPLLETKKPDDYLDALAKESYWSLEMVTAWIAWRTKLAVVEFWPEYRKSSERWEQFRNGKGWTISTRPNPSYLSLLVNDGIVRSSTGEDSFEGITVETARQDLWAKLLSGKLEALGVRTHGPHCAIPSTDWLTLEWSEKGQPSCVNYKHHIVPAYIDVRLASEDVVKIWLPPVRPISIWDFALAKCGNDKDATARLVMDFYAAYWRGEFDGLKLTLVQNKPVIPGKDDFENFGREWLAIAALGEQEFRRKGAYNAYEDLASWSMTDYRKIRPGYRYYFIPNDNIGSMESQRLGLCAPSSVLENWCVGSATETAILPTASVEKQSTSRSPKLSLAEAIKFMELRYKNWQVGLPYPNETDDLKALEQNFPDNQVPRAVVRAARGKLPPAWRNQGPKKTRSAATVK